MRAQTSMSALLPSGNEPTTFTQDIGHNHFNGFFYKNEDWETVVNPNPHLAGILDATNGAHGQLFQLL